MGKGRNSRGRLSAGQRPAGCFWTIYIYSKLQTIKPLSHFGGFFESETDSRTKKEPLVFVYERMNKHLIYSVSTLTPSDFEKRYIYCFGKLRMSGNSPNRNRNML